MKPPCNVFNSNRAPCGRDATFAVFGANLTGVITCGEHLADAVSMCLYSLAMPDVQVQRAVEIPDPVAPVAEV